MHIYLGEIEWFFMSELIFSSFWQDHHDDDDVSEWSSSHSLIDSHEFKWILMNAFELLGFYIFTIEKKRTLIRNHIQLLIISFNLILCCGTSHHLIAFIPLLPLLRLADIKGTQKNSIATEIRNEQNTSLSIYRTNKSNVIFCSLSTTKYKMNQYSHRKKSERKENKWKESVSWRRISGRVESRKTQPRWMNKRTNQRMNEWMSGWIKKKHKRKIHTALIIC